MSARDPGDISLVNCDFTNISVRNSTSIILVGGSPGPGMGCVQSLEVINLDSDSINFTFPGLPVCRFGAGGQFLKDNYLAIYGEDVDENCRCFKLTNDQWEEIQIECQCNALAKSVVIQKNLLKKNRIHSNNIFLDETGKNIEIQKFFIKSNS